MQTPIPRCQRAVTAASSSAEADAPRAPAAVVAPVATPAACPKTAFVAAHPPTAGGEKEQVTDEVAAGASEAVLEADAPAQAAPPAAP